MQLNATGALTLTPTLRRDPGHPRDVSLLDRLFVRTHWTSLAQSGLVTNSGLRGAESGWAEGSGLDSLLRSQCLVASLLG